MVEDAIIATIKNYLTSLPDFGIHACRAVLFGSYVLGKADEYSDIDLIVRFSKRKSLLAMVRLERELTEALGRKVDLLTEAAISPYMRERVLKEMQVVYGSR